MMVKAVFVLVIGVFGFKICFEFRVSDFEFAGHVQRTQIFHFGMCPAIVGK